MERFLKFCRDNRKTTLLVLAAVLLITVLQIASFFSRSGSYITDENGRIVAIAREDADEVLSVPVKVKAVRGSLQTEQNLILSLSGKGKAASRKAESMVRKNSLWHKLNLLPVNSNRAVRRESDFPAVLRMERTSFGTEKGTDLPLQHACFSTNHVFALQRQPAEKTQPGET